MSGIVPAKIAMSLTMGELAVLPVELGELDDANSSSLEVSLDGLEEPPALDPFENNIRRFETVVQTSQMRKYRPFAGDVASDFCRLKSEGPAALRIDHL
jgi:hypothetical protein